MFVDGLEQGLVDVAVAKGARLDSLEGLGKLTRQIGLLLMGA